MYKYIVLILFALSLYAYPRVIYGPSLQVECEDTICLEDNLIISSCSLSIDDEKAYLLLHKGQLIEIHRNTSIFIDLIDSLFYILDGKITIHTQSPPGTLVFKIDPGQNPVRYAGKDSIYIELPDRIINLVQGSRYKDGDYKVYQEAWYIDSRSDAEYLFKLIDKDKLPDKYSDFKFPSIKPSLFWHNARGYGGIATYRDQEYYYTGFIYQMRFWEFRFAYDLWLAFESGGRFYSEAYDEWRDLIDRIYYIQFYKREDPFFLRAGLIENLSFAEGLLVSDYNNAVFLPFEKRTGLELRINSEKFQSDIFVNDIGLPRVIGMETKWKTSNRVEMGVAYAGDFNQFCHMKDNDEDSYPDEIDPNPDSFDSPDDSIVSGLPRLDEVETRQLHGASFNINYRFIRAKYFNSDLYGELAALSNVGTGLTFPNLFIKYRWFRLGIGLDIQTPGFQQSIFGRDYETKKAYIDYSNEDEPTIVSANNILDETEGWLYGWNNSFKVSVPGYVTLSTKFKDIYRENDRDKYFSLKLNIERDLFKYITKVDFFIEQNNVKHIFQKATDDESWGIEIEVQPHESIRAKARFRMIYEDENLDGLITSSEKNTNFNGSVIVDGDYWWRKYLDWRREKKANQ